jgi:DNA-binding MarR family transcriptional regulator
LGFHRHAPFINDRTYPSRNNPKRTKQKLHIAPSTSTRFVKKLELKKLVVRENERKLTRIYLTEDGVKIQEQIKKY